MCIPAILARQHITLLWMMAERWLEVFERKLLEEEDAKWLNCALAIDNPWILRQLTVPGTSSVMDRCTQVQRRLFQPLNSGVNKFESGRPTLSRNKAKLHYGRDEAFNHVMKSFPLTPLRGWFPPRKLHGWNHQHFRLVNPFGSSVSLGVIRLWIGSPADSRALFAG